MFYFNTKTEVNKEFKMREILKLIKCDKNIRKEVSYVEKIILTNVISEDLLNIKSDDSCKEIYIFKIVLKEKKVPIEFIKSLDRVIKLHTYFVLEFQDEVKEFLIYRYIKNDNIIRRNMYQSSWNTKELKQMPYCMTIKEIYNNLIFNLIDLKPRDDEEMNSFLERFNNIQKIKKEINVLKKRGFRETQPRKKFEIGRQIIKLRKDLEDLGGNNNGQA